MADITSPKDKTQKKDNLQFDVSYFPQSTVITNSLNDMFPDHMPEDKTTKQANAILGEAYSLEETKELIASYEFLINKWLEAYEKNLFDNKTLKELLQGF